MTDVTPTERIVPTAHSRRPDEIRFRLDAKDWNASSHRRASTQ